MVAMAMGCQCPVAPRTIRLNAAQAVCKNHSLLLHVSYKLSVSLLITRVKLLKEIGFGSVTLTTFKICILRAY